MAPTNDQLPVLSASWIPPMIQLYLVVPLSLLLVIVVLLARRYRSHSSRPAFAVDHGKRDDQTVYHDTCEEKSHALMPVESRRPSHSFNPYTDTPLSFNHHRPLPLPTLGLDDSETSSSHTISTSNAHHQSETSLSIPQSPISQGPLTNSAHNTEPSTHGHISAEPPLLPDAQQQGWQPISTTERHFAPVVSPNSCSQSNSNNRSIMDFPQLRKETVQKFRGVGSASQKTCRRKIIEYG